MPTRCLQIFLACLWFLWTGVVLPAHTPGDVAFRIGPPTLAEAAPRCPLCPPTKSKSPAQPYYGCAMCDLKVKLYSGTIHIPSLAPAGFLEIARAPPALIAPFFPTPHLFHSRAPPSLLAV